MVRKINMKGGGNEVIILIAVLFICILIGGAAITLWPLDECKDGIPATDKCKCGEKECKKGETCNDGACDADDGSASPDPPDATADGTCVESATTTVVADAALCAAVTALNSATACDAVMTTADATASACTYAAASPPPPPASGTPPPAGGPPAGINHPCMNQRSCVYKNDEYVCRPDGLGVDGGGYYHNSQTGPEQNNYCSMCPPGSKINIEHGGIDDCLCDGLSKWLNTATTPPSCEDCGADKIRDSGICVCNLGINKIPTSGDPEVCIDATDQPSNPFIDVGISDPFNTLDPSLHKYLLSDYPACTGAGQTCNMNPINSAIINNLVYYDPVTSQYMNRYPFGNPSPNVELIQDGGGVPKCGTPGKILVVNGLRVTCESNACFVDAATVQNSQDIPSLNRNPGIGCVNDTTLLNKFYWDSDQVKLSDKDGNLRDSQAALLDLCPSGDTCANQCGGLSDVVGSGIDGFDFIQGKCGCKTGYDITTNSHKICNASGDMCLDIPCDDEILPGANVLEGETINWSGRDNNCDCICQNGRTRAHDGECSILPVTSSTENPATPDNPATPGNGYGLCWNDSVKNNGVWTQEKYDAAAITDKSTLTDGEGTLLSMSYKEGGKWVHECRDVTDIPDTNRANPYNPFTRYRCQINEVYNLTTNHCDPIARGCDRKPITPGTFIGHHRIYSPECSFNGANNDGTQTHTDNPEECCDTCAGIKVDKPWHDDHIYGSGRLTETNYFTSTYLDGATADTHSYSGVGYNTRPTNYMNNSAQPNPAVTDGMVGPGGAGPAQIKENLFVCKKTNFPHSGSRISHDIGAPTSSDDNVYTTDNVFTGLDPTNCSTGPDSNICQENYKYFAPTDRTVSSERYLWMKEGNNYGFQTVGFTGCDQGNLGNLMAPGDTGFPSGRNIFPPATYITPQCSAGIPGFEMGGQHYNTSDFSDDEHTTWNNIRTGLTNMGLSGIHASVLDDSDSPKECELDVRDNTDYQTRCWRGTGSGAQIVGHNTEKTFKRVGSSSSVDVKCRAEMFYNEPSTGDDHVYVRARECIVP